MSDQNYTEHLLSSNDNKDQSDLEPNIKIEAIEHKNSKSNKPTELIGVDDESRKLIKLQNQVLDLFNKFQEIDQELNGECCDCSKCKKCKYSMKKLFSAKNIRAILPVVSAISSIIVMLYTAVIIGRAADSVHDFNAKYVPINADLKIAQNNQKLLISQYNVWNQVISSYQQGLIQSISMFLNFDQILNNTAKQLILNFGLDFMSFNVGDVIRLNDVNNPNLIFINSTSNRISLNVSTTQNIQIITKSCNVLLCTNDDVWPVEIFSVSSRVIQLYNSSLKILSIYVSPGTYAQGSIKFLD